MADFWKATIETVPAHWRVSCLYCGAEANSQVFGSKSENEFRIALKERGWKVEEFNLLLRWICPKCVGVTK